MITTFGFGLDFCDTIYLWIYLSVFIVLRLDGLLHQTPNNMVYACQNVPHAGNRANKKVYCTIW